MNTPANRLGLEMLSGIGLPPVEFVKLASGLGCAHISVGPTQMPPQYNPLNYPHWSLKDDANLRRELLAALRDTGVSISLGEGFAVRPGVSMRDRGDEMDIMAELGARGLGAVSMEPDMARAKDEFATLVELAGERGMLATMEFAPIQVVNTLALALEFVRHADRPNCGVLLDAMHFFRSGATVADLQALPAGIVRYAQLCDVPMVPTEPSYLTEAMTMRFAPGEGELPLAEFVEALPEDIPLGLEIPNLVAAQSGVDPVERLRPAVTGARLLLEGNQTC